jgi:hypothetical protein
VTASEFIFLALGLILGIAAGAALIEVLRARPPAPREVRLTMSTDAVPRRSSTLAEATQVVAPGEPARGGPADRREGGLDPIDGGPDRRTPVRSAPVAVPMGAGPQPGQVMEPAFPLHDPAPVSGAIPVSSGTDPMLGAFRASAAASATAAMRRPAATAVLDAGEANGAPAAAAAGAASGDDRSRAQEAGLDASDAGRPSSGADTGESASPVVSAAPVEDGPCAEVRRIAGERCELATRAREQAGTAEASLRAAQRAYDQHEQRSDAAQASADPRAIRQAKDAAQDRFRTARAAADTNDALESAARTWLSEVNDINAAAREAATALARERAAAQQLAMDLERRALEADAARIAAETAEAACLEAREAMATCDEEMARGEQPGPVHTPGSPFPLHATDPETDVLPAALAGGARAPRIFRLLRGDRAAMGEMVAALAGDDPDERRRWQLAIAGLIDAIVADAIEAATLEFPDDHPFWGPFTVGQDRDIVRALASLGYRFDGLGGWQDDRAPSQRDLSLALGYAGLDPMRTRHWPDEAETAALFSEVTVAADEHLAGAAGDLTLGELVSMLGRRADGLAELWNHWGRIRPLLLDEA